MASLFLAGGSLADTVWTGRATQSIHRRLEPEIALADLGRAWSPLNVENYVYRLARPGLDLQVTLAKRDTVVMPELSDGLLLALKSAGGRPRTLSLNCGHYSLEKLPYIFYAGLSLKRFRA